MVIVDNPEDGFSTLPSSAVTLFVNVTLPEPSRLNLSSFCIAYPTGACFSIRVYLPAGRPVSSAASPLVVIKVI